MQTNRAETEKHKQNIMYIDFDWKRIVEDKFVFWQSAFQKKKKKKKKNQKVYMCK